MGELSDIDILELSTTDSDEFMDILWTALNPEGVTGRTRSILTEPVIRAYYENWGQAHDIGYAAVKEGQMIGAIWCRIKDCVTTQYAEYPELGIGVLPDYQNTGIGSELLKVLIDACRDKYPGIRLGVNAKAIRVLSFYKSFGFSVYDKYNGAPQLQLTF